jgi:hypothetical protein
LNRAADDRLLDVLTAAGQKKKNARPEPAPEPK